MKEPSKAAKSADKIAASGLPVKEQIRQESFRFPIVGIGASAGGLEALEQFLRSVPADSGMAFVIVQHLDPNHKGILVELLQRTTTMEVFQVTDRMEVKPNCVYVIPPNKDMSILHGLLHLFEPVSPRGLRLPIDFFFRSLAEDRQTECIGVILSGMGSDGTLGLQAIKGQAGLVLAQEPATAKFDSMPRSAIATGLTDIIAPAEDLPAKIIDYLCNPLEIDNKELPLVGKDQSALEKVIILLRSRSGHDFSLYKKNTLYRRIDRRMNIHQIDRIAVYVRYLQENPQELDLLFKELLIGVTSFFRDPVAWEELRSEVIPDLMASLPAGGTLRAWSAGCSTGEEAYSLAMVFREAQEQFKPARDFSTQIFATDLDKDAIDKARQGLYSAKAVADVSAERLHRFFVPAGKDFLVCKEIRQMVTFATQNVIMDAPFTKLDLVSCRNLLIYLTPELQKRLLPLFHYSLNPGGILFLGSAESVSSFTHLFGSLSVKSRLFRRRESFLPTELHAFPVSLAPVRTGVPKELAMIKPAVNLQTLADQLLLQHFSPPAALTNDKGDILYISGKTGKYLEPAAGKANWNLFAMARDGLRFELNSAFNRALREKKPITVKGLKIDGADASQTVDINVQAIAEPEALRGMVMIVFNDVATPPVKRAASRSKTAPSGETISTEVEEELQRVRAELQATREEMQTSREEQISANEELQSTNEELQSTNEELTTSREEMQSLNEELQTVNAEQQAKMEELSRVHTDMRNLLNSTEIVTIFLDNDLHLRRFTPGADKLFKLIPSDIGRPLSDIVSNLRYPELSEDERMVLQTLVFSEKQVPATDGRWFTVRIMPYRTMEDVTAGLVLTFTNITAAKELEAELRAENAELKKLLESKK